ncbi:phosphatidylethanolamine-binding protein [Mycolicibacterium madagascariense]|uniref:Phosphatidylethanolamine-binding protein n=1 Tax=Mycolicibacterium madagascariense TaxID=212765 RepID=A0A7I7XJM8_9MYCO|nr:YbhB/YbcL family Raf kinase inhibitor-like protein [Mycolicibacterium madagascariense]MCV7013016.1 YbhB/YbcL family Raf kinase inhibitor-like protein [Mycolicibacterium madagascariense]BBZ29409.1 phosphatidylethanolamine-binding protein [Mycolicibacterium madagascariense]
MTGIGGLLKGIRSSGARSPLARTEFEAPGTIVVTSPAFEDGAPIPRRHAGRGVGDDVSPELSWEGVPPSAAALVVLLDDVDVPLPRPLWHSAAVLDPGLSGLAEGGFTTGTPGVRIVPTMLGRHGYSGPRPIPGHGAHHYRFHVLALDRPVPSAATSVKAVLAAAAGHVLARGTLTGTYER